MKRDDEKKGTAVCLYAKRAVLNDNVEMAKKNANLVRFFSNLETEKQVPGIYTTWYLVMNSLLTFFVFFLIYLVEKNKAKGTSTYNEHKQYFGGR